MDSAADVHDILSKLQFLGFCGDLNISEAAGTDPSEVFDAVLAAFLRQAYPGGREARPLPVALVDGRRVDLLRLFTAVRAAGGYAAISSFPIAWASAAESAGLDGFLAAPVKLLYAKYLGALDRWIQRLSEAQGPGLDGNGTNNPDLFSGCANAREKEKPFVDCSEEEEQHAILKRKRADMAGMLGWVRELAENAWDGAAVNSRSVDGYFSAALVVREVVSVKRVRRTSMTNGSLLQEMFPMDCKRCMSSTYVRTDGQAKCSKELQLLIEHRVSCLHEFTSVLENNNGPLMIIEQENNLTGRGKHDSSKHHNSFDGWLFSSQQRNEVPVGSDYQAKVPQWTGDLSATYDNPETLKWLGTRVWPPENGNKNAPFCSDPIGKGRDDVCGCKVPGSVDCVRFHVAERRLLLRHELGSAFFDWGFDRMGEEIALSWTDEEEANFKAVVRLNASPSCRNFWNRLLLLFHLKGRKELVSYYFNCFLLRRRCYQNRITPKNIDSDDEDETEFGFLGSRLGHTATKYHSTKHNICVQSTHCMDLD